MKYGIYCKENGDLIDIFENECEAKKTLNNWEKEDTKEGIYVENFYEIKQYEN